VGKDIKSQALHINDLNIKTFLGIILAIQLALWGTIGLGAIGLQIPIIREFIGFIYLTFVPGIIILRIFRLHELGNTRTLLYAVGLSIATLMFTGLFVNTVYPIFGISEPISIYPVILTLTALTLILSTVAYMRDKDFRPTQAVVEAKGRTLSPVLFLLLLPVLAALGALFVAHQQTNAILLILMVLIALTTMFVAFNKFIPSKYYAFAVVTIALALLLQYTLISQSLSGCDIYVEYYFQNLVLTNSHWDSLIPNTVNAMLSITILCPFYSLILGMDSIWVFKIIYPLIFSLVPLALFEIYREQTSDRKAFLAVFFSMSAVGIFFLTMPSLARQQIAELFFVLLVLLMVERKLTLPQKTVLGVIFAISLTVSHYGLAYIAVAFLAFGWIFLFLSKSPKASNWWQKLSQKVTRSSVNPDIIGSTSENSSSTSILNGTLVCLYVVFLLSWYMYTSSGSAFNTIIHVGGSVYTNISEFFEPTARTSLVGAALGVGWAEVPTLGKAFRVLQYLTQLFIVVGFVKLILRPRALKFRLEYTALTIVSALILLACIVLPYFAQNFNMARFYHVCLLLLAPLCILGAEAIWHSLSRLTKSISCRIKAGGPASITNPSSSTYLRFLAVAILIPYFLFTSGFVSEIGKWKLPAGTIPTTEPLSSYRVDATVYNQNEAAAVTWLVDRVYDKEQIYADGLGKLLLYGKFLGQVGVIPASGEVPLDAYIFLRTWNVEKQEIIVYEWHGAQFLGRYVSLSDVPKLFKNRQVVYNNGKAKILR